MASDTITRGPAGATAAAQWDDQPDSDRQRYGGAPGCSKCDATLGPSPARLDINAGSVDASRWRLCGKCYRELMDWLEVPFQPLIESPDANPRVIPREKHQ